MTMNPQDEGIELVRNVREMISLEFDNDARRLVEHYMQVQEAYRTRLIAPAAAPREDATGDTPPRR